MNGIVRIDRELVVSVHPIVVEFLSPEIQNTGPAEYRVASLWGELGFGRERLSGDDILKMLTELGLINSCLRYRDLLLIQNTGPAFFRHVAPKDQEQISAWASAFRGKGGHTYVPYLRLDRGPELRIGFMDSKVKIWNQERGIHRFRG